MTLDQLTRTLDHLSSRPMLLVPPEDREHAETLIASLPPHYPHPKVMGCWQMAPNDPWQLCEILEVTAGEADSDPGVQAVMRALFDPQH
jgi:hypothetical protein